MLDAAVVVEVLLVLVLTDVEVVLTLVLDVLELVELVENEVVDVLVLVVLVLELVELVLVENVDVELVLLEVELVLVLDVLVLVVTLSSSRSSPSANLYTLPDTTAEALGRWVWFIARMYGSTARDNSLSCPVLSLYPHTPVVCSQIVHEPMFWIVS